MTKEQKRRVERILSYEAPHIVARIQNKHNIKLEAAKNRFDECLKYLSLALLDPGYLHSPSLRVDTAWHEFILHTKDYREFCESYVGKFIDHQPGFANSEEVTVAYNRTIEQLRLHFGKLDGHYWPSESQDRKDRSPCANCGVLG